QAGEGGGALEITGVADLNGTPGIVGNYLSIQPSGATLQLLSDGSFSYTPTNGYSFEHLNDGETGSDGFTYTVSDGIETATVSVNFTINGVDDPPPTITAVPPG